MKRKALGKGLAALLPDPESAARPTRRPRFGRPPRTRPAPAAPNMDPARLRELAASIPRAAWCSPSWCGAGALPDHRRRAALARGAELGLPPSRSPSATCPTTACSSWPSSRTSSARSSRPLEEAQAFQRLQEELGLAQEEIARRVGRDRTTVANALRLLRLPREVRELLAAGALDAGHARALLALERAEDQLALAREAARKGLSVREVERRVALLRAPRSGARAARGAEHARRRGALRAALGHAGGDRAPRQGRRRSA